MPAAKCIRRCWDSQATKRYWPGMIEDLDANHIFLKKGCFELITKEEMKSQQNNNEFEKRMLLMKEEILNELKGNPVVDDIEEKRGPGRPPKVKE